ncbi:MAG: tetratricopeptide repeat protein [Methylococcales bacterium]|nr:tetratricopeptide repeat protein [Methylococcales bacterium]
MNTPEPSQADIDELLTLFAQDNYSATKIRAGELIARFPDHGFGWKVLGVVLRQQGQITASLVPMQKAAELLPDDAEAHSNLGVTLMNQGRLSEAVISYRHALALNPDTVDVHHHLGLTLMTLGHWAKAELSYRRVLELNPDYPDAHYNLGHVLQQQGQLPEAEACYRRVLAAHPELSDAHSNLACVLQWQGQHTEAEQHYQQALALNPQDVKAYSNLGMLLQAQGRLTEARDCYQCALEINPQFAEAYNNLGLSLQGQGRLAKAEAAYRRALAINPNNAEAHNNLGIIFQQHAQLLDALASYQRALALKPNDAQVHNNLGAVYQELGRMAQAEASFRRALAINPDYTEARSNLLLAMTYHGAHSPAEYLAEAVLYGQQIQHKVESPFTTWHCNPCPERLRIGLVLGDLHHHEVGQFLTQLLPELDSSSVEVYAYPTHPHTDELTLTLPSLFSVWQSLLGLSDTAAARLIHADGIHILFDLSGHHNYNRLPVFAYKPAPVQVNWLGFLASSGLAAMDYVLGDPYATPSDDDDIFSESLWQLPDTYRCFSVPEGAESVNPLPALANHQITFANFNAPSHINEAVLAVWARILHAVPQSQLLLKNQQLNNATACQNLCQQFAEQGILPERLLLEGDTASLADYQRVDIILDTFPYNGASSSIQALWMGVPVLTLSGDRFTARRGASMLANVELNDWIAFDDDDMVAKSMNFAADTDYLMTLRTTLRPQLLASPLVDTISFARHFEAALWSMYQS